MPVPHIRRPDFNHSLVHLTKERKQWLAHDGNPRLVIAATAFNVLKEIISSGIIRGGGPEGYIKANHRAVCLSEIPLSAVHHFPSPPDQDEARYRFYGIAFSKRSIFKLGGRPVIYLPDSEGDWIPLEQKWRHVRYEIGAVDFTHEREWRLLGDLDLRTVPQLYLLVWSLSEAAELRNFSSPVQNRIGGIFPMEVLTTML